MEKTKFGLSVAMLAAIIYLSAILGYIPLIICAGYALVFESSKFLKRHAISAIMFIVVLEIVYVILFSIIGSIFGIINIPINWIATVTKTYFKFRLGYPLSLEPILKYLIVIVRYAGLLIFAFMASKGKKAMKFANKFFPDDAE